LLLAGIVRDSLATHACDIPIREESNHDAFDRTVRGWLNPNAKNTWREPESERWSGLSDHPILGSAGGYLDRVQCNRICQTRSFGFREAELVIIINPSTASFHGRSFNHSQPPHMLLQGARRTLLHASRKLTTATSNMAKLDINSTYRLNSGHSIPILGYGVSLELNFLSALLTSTGVSNVRNDQWPKIIAHHTCKIQAGGRC
jgi:hypothetical protein